MAEKFNVTGEQYYGIDGQMMEIKRQLRLNGGSSLNPEVVKKALQEIIEPKSKRLKLGLIPEKSKKWREENGVIYFEVTSDGATGQQWIERLKKRGFEISTHANELLLSQEFKPTTGITYKIAVLSGGLFTRDNRVTKEIFNEAVVRKLTIPNSEVACLIREMFSDEEIKDMGLAWIVTFHKPIKDSGGGLSLLHADRGDGASWLDASYGHSDGNWNDDNGFAFEVSQEKVA